MLPAAERFPEARGLIEGEGYFVLHAPRPTGKTTTLRALAKELTAEGRYAALHFTCEMAQAALDDIGRAEGLIVDELRLVAARALPAELQPPPMVDATPGGRLRATLEAGARRCPRPLVLFFDEIDAVRGESLIFDRRPDAPPPEERTRFEEAVTAKGRRVIVLRA